jgi:hypothetical protein
MARDYSALWRPLGQGAVTALLHFSKQLDTQTLRGGAPLKHARATWLQALAGSGWFLHV